MKIPSLLERLIVYAAANKTAIKTGIAMGGVIATSVAVADATVKTKEKLEKLNYSSKDKAPSTKEKFFAVGRYWIRPIILAGGTVYLIYSVNDDGNKAIASIAAAYSMKDGELKDYTDKVLEIAGKKKAEDIRDAIEIDKVQNNPPKEEAIINTGKGQTLCYDGVMGRYFRSDMQSVREAVNDLNEMLIIDGFACLNDFYDNLGLPNIDIGDNLGWVYDDTKEKLSATYTSTLTDSGTPVMVVSYNLEPIYIRTGSWAK